MSTTDTTLRGRTTLEWPTPRSVYLTLDFECDFGTALPENTYQAVGHAGRLAALLERLDVPLTCFVQTELLDERPETVEALRQSSLPVTFHPHSHTHRPRDRTSVPEEIAESTARYREFFGEAPTGYRFPNGNVRDEDYRHLADHGYAFDASVFPSWRPRHFNNMNATTRPQYLPEYDLFELPFTVYSDAIRIPTALSYCRLIGRPYTSLLTRRPPSVVVFNIHMHDLVTPPSYASLPPHYRALYARNDDGFGLLERALTRFARRGYAFGLVDDVHRRLRTAE